MKVGYKIIIGITIGLLCSNTVSGQKEERKQIRQGNKSYKNEKYTESEIAYRKSLEVNPRSTEGIFNLGNALYRQEKYPEAAEQYQLIAAQKERFLSENPANIERLAQVFHNLGNIGMKNKEYAKSVEAYKQSLRMNPKDDETRYNLALAQKLLDDQQNQEQEQDQNKDDQQEEQQQDQNQNEEQNQEQQQDDQKENKTQEEQQQNEQMSQDNAQQILDAFLQDEKDTQEKVKQAQAKQQERRKTDKQW